MAHIHVETQHAEAAETYVWGECTPLYSRGPIATAPGYSISMNRIVLNPKAHGTPHRHHTTEYLTFISGTARVTISGQAPVDAVAQTTVTIPAGALHYVENTSETDRLNYIAIRIGTPRNIILDEVDTPHGCPPTVTQ